MKTKTGSSTWTLVVISALVATTILGHVASQLPAAAVADHNIAPAKGVARADWIEQAKLLPVAGAPDDNFGYTVDTDGEYAVVGAIGDSNQSGAAYVFARDAGGWTEMVKLTAPTRVPGDNFGYSVAISGDTAIVGAVGDRANGDNAGAAYVFVRNEDSWTLQTKLTASDGAKRDSRWSFPQSPRAKENSYGISSTFPFVLRPSMCR